jgi:pilus assembly protein CpaD
MMMRKALPLAALALVLSACGGTVNRGMESVHQPIVQRTDYVLDVATSGYGLQPGEKERLDGWFRSIGLSFGDRVAIDDPTGSGAARVDVAELLSRRGMSLGAGSPVTGPVPDGSVRVVVSRATASVPGCPDWSRKASPELVGSTMSNYGCASNAVLAAMVADPLDLIEGRAPGEVADTDISTRAINTYRTSAPTGTRGLKTESTSKVGK